MKKALFIISLLIVLVACKYEPLTHKQYYSDNEYDWQPDRAASTWANRSTEYVTEGKYSIELYSDDGQDGKWKGWASWSKKLKENLTNVKCVLLDMHSNLEMNTSMLFHDNIDFGRSTNKAPETLLKKGWNYNLLFFIPDRREDYGKLGEIQKIEILVGMPFSNASYYADNFRIIKNETLCYMIENNDAIEIKYESLTEEFFAWCFKFY